MTGPLPLEHLDTPNAVVDVRVAEANLARAQDYADRHGLALWPHVKTHKLPRFARRQLDLGARGITCQKLGEAEVMAAAGLGPIFLPYNIFGGPKLARLRALHAAGGLSVTADDAVVVEGYGAAVAGTDAALPVLVECDTGAGRCGVATPEAAAGLARTIDRTPGLHFAGLMTYPPRGRTAEVEAWLAAAVADCGRAGLAAERVSNGGTPDMWRAHEVATAREYRPGTYIYFDRMQAGFGAGGLDDCALTVLATVVARPAADRAVLDAGSKALAADTCAAGGHGHLREYPEAAVTALHEEHAIVDLAACRAHPTLGERVRVIPNHVCVVSNLFDEVYLTEDGVHAEAVPVAARGRVR